MNTQFKKGALELCVLSQLVRGDKYGYELTERISDEMSIAGGTLYPILRKLKADDYVTTYLVESESGPARKYYKLTDKEAVSVGCKAGMGSIRPGGESVDYGVGG